MSAARATRLVRLAPRVVVVPAGDSVPPDDGVIVLPQHPSRAFGDGSHPTTRLCARAVDLVCRQHAPAAVLDVGTGTGVLARIARAHGAAFVVATDIDDESLRVTGANVALDGGGVHVHDARTHAPDAWGPRFDLVIANILAEVLAMLAPALVGALAPGGRLLLSGFTPLQAPFVRAAFGHRCGAPLVPEVQAELEGWCVLQLRRGVDEAR